MCSRPHKCLLHPIFLTYQDVLLLFDYVLVVFVDIC
ncbi:hypothetical protein KSS87_006941, partial [Heliosperma pusillum]